MLLAGSDESSHDIERTTAERTSPTVAWLRQLLIRDETYTDVVGVHGKAVNRMVSEITLIPDRDRSVELAKRLLVDSIWKTANIEVDGITFPDTQEIFDGRAPADMTVDEIVTVNNIKHAWQFLLENVDYPIDWQYVSEYNRIIGEGLVRDAGMLRAFGVRIGGTEWTPELPSVDSSRDMVGSIMLQDDPLGRALDLFGAITRGQWFADGNKRTALMVANHELIHAGIGILAIPPSDKREFTTRLLSYYESGDYHALKDWLTYNAFGRVPGGLTEAQMRAIGSNSRRDGVSDGPEPRKERKHRHRLR